MTLEIYMRIVLNQDQLYLYDIKLRLFRFNLKCYYITLMLFYKSTRNVIKLNTSKKFESLTIFFYSEQHFV